MNQLKPHLWLVVALAFAASTNAEPRLHSLHGTTLGPKFNPAPGDWTGYAQEDLEERIAGVVGLCTIGAGADASRWKPRTQSASSGSGRVLEIERLGDLLAVGGPDAVPPAQTGPKWFELISLRQDSADLARQILDESRERKEREQLIEDHPELSAELLEQMTADFPPGTDEEYRRIPWIWRLAIAAGRRNNIEEIRSILELSLPQPDQPLRDWQAVVIGGGIVNGISQSGAWPGERIEEVLKSEPDLAARWRRTLQLASTMADDHDIRTPTRYDALRIIGLDTWDRRGAQLVKYLAEGVEEELQMGAVSALGDMQEPQVAEALLSGLRHYSDRNRNLALDALLRSEARQKKLLAAVEAERVDPSALGRERVEALKNSESSTIRSRADRLLP